MKQANHSSGDFLLPFFDGCAVAHGPFQQILLRHAFRLMAQQIRGNLLRDSAFVLRNRLECSAQRVTARGQSRLTVSDLCAAGEDQILRLALRRRRERVADCRCQRDYNVIGSLGVADGLPCLEPSREVFCGHTLLLATFRVHFDGSRWDVHFRLGKVTLGAPLVQSTDDPGAGSRMWGRCASQHRGANPRLRRAVPTYRRGSIRSISATSIACRARGHFWPNVAACRFSNALKLLCEARGLNEWREVSPVGL